jgi:hypothetical protein
MASSMDVSAFPNVMDLRSRSSQMVGVSIAFLIPVWVSIVLRVYVRVCMAKAFGWDDGIMILAAVSPLPMPYRLCRLDTDFFADVFHLFRRIVNRHRGIWFQ